MHRWQIIEQQDGTWHVIDESGQRVAEGATYQAALEALLPIAAGHLAADPPGASSAGRFRAPALPEGIETSDDRLIEDGATYWRTPPLPLMLQTQTEIGHFGAELAGRITTIERADKFVVLGGDLDDTDAGRQAAQILTDRERFGISVDLGRMEVEWECIEFDEEEGYCSRELMRVSEAELIGATMTPFPAFAEAYIALEGAATSTEDDDAEAASATVNTPPAPRRASQHDMSLVRGHRSVARVASLDSAVIAAAIPTRPPAEWFEDPGFTEPQPMTVTEDGRVFGHACLWDSCHQGREDVCLTPPRSATDYSIFRVGEVACDADCDPIPTGTIVLGTEHASLKEAHQAAWSHYANSGHAIADVACGEDEFGLWFSGALRPGATPEQIRELRGSVISGDWRRVGGSMELVAMLAVNAPGYPVPRLKASRVASGAETPLAMVAAGAIPAPPSEDELRIRDLERRLQRVEAIALAPGNRKAAAAAWAASLGAGDEPS